ncbi:MAG TPA: glycosyl hydrolase [Opitutaceae bacterium]|nr:glycosyl hydrolase [Opitutaceae bacterium]
MKNATGEIPVLITRYIAGGLPGMNIANTLRRFLAGPFFPLRLLSLLLAAGAAAQAAPDPRFGVMTHFAQGWDPVWADIVGLRGIATVRDELYWNAVESQPGVFKFPAAFDTYMAALRNNQISPLIVLSFENPNYDGGMTPYTPAGFSAYGRYATEVLKHYGSQIQSLEVWNEYNGSFCQGPATSDRAGTYTKMLQAAYSAIKAARPDVTVLGGATAGAPLPYWEKLMADGALTSMDALSIHPYRYDSPPEGIENDVLALQALTRQYNHGQTKPIWVTEIGWGTNDAGGVPISEATQASYLVRAYALLLSVNVERVYWYLFRDYNNLSMGLTKDDATPKAAAFAMEVMIRELSGAGFVTKEATANGVYSLAFSGPSGEVRVMWSLQPTTLAVTGQTRVVDLSGNVVAMPDVLSLTDSPLFVEGPVRGLAPAAPSGGSSSGAATTVTGGAEQVLVDSARDFSSPWTYGAFVGSSTTLETLTNYSVTDWTQQWGGGYPYLSVSPGDQHPSTMNGQQVSAVRRWVSRVEGTVHITGKFACGAQGDGVGVRILVDGVPLFRKLLGGGGAQQETFDFTQAVHVGTPVDFAVDPGPGLNIDFDATTVSATISTGGN